MIKAIPIALIASSLAVSTSQPALADEIVGGGTGVGFVTSLPTPSDGCVHVSSSLFEFPVTSKYTSVTDNGAIVEVGLDILLSVSATDYYASSTGWYRDSICNNGWVPHTTTITEVPSTTNEGHITCPAADGMMSRESARSLLTINFTSRCTIQLTLLGSPLTATADLKQSLQGVVTGLDNRVGYKYTAENPTDTPRGPYTDWIWPAGYHTSIEHSLTIHVVPQNQPVFIDANDYFWAHQFGFEGGDGGYNGLQENGVRRADGSRGKMAIFSLWQANAASGPACGPFDGEGEGYSCSIAYDWLPEREYRLRTSYVSVDSMGTWWGTWVRDQVTGIETYVGMIRVPLAWGDLSYYSIVWTEFFGSDRDCSLPGPYGQNRPLSYSAVSFTNITRNGGTIAPTSHHNHMSTQGNCGGGIIDIPGGVLHRMGGRL